MSKFEYGSFYGGYDNFAVSKQKFTKEEKFSKGYEYIKLTI